MAMATSNDLERAIVSVVGDGKMAQPVFPPNDTPQPPYVRLMPDKASITRATDRSWIWRVPYSAILCTRYRDRSLERQMAAALEQAGIAIDDLSWSYDSDERVFMAIFYTTAVIESEE